jgi:(p)ppGpp synthase/HD superfamily hydrolase
MLTERFDQALAYASTLHREQMRKGTAIPYVSHLLAVCAIVLEHGGSEDDAIAALLHDGPEDQGGRDTLDTIRTQFGTGVADIVAACTDTFEDPKPEWLTRKVAYLAHLEHEPSPSVLLVSASDKLHNLRAIRADFAILGNDLWRRFNGRPGQQLWYFTRLAAIYDERLPGRLSDAFSREVAGLQHDLAAIGIRIEEPQP